MMNSELILFECILQSAGRPSDTDFRTFTLYVNCLSFVKKLNHQCHRNFYHL